MIVKWKMSKDLEKQWDIRVGEQYEIYWVMLLCKAGDTSQKSHFLCPSKSSQICPVFLIISEQKEYHLLTIKKFVFFLLSGIFIQSSASPHCFENWQHSCPFPSASNRLQALSYPELLKTEWIKDNSVGFPDFSRLKFQLSLRPFLGQDNLVQCISILGVDVSTYSLFQRQCICIGSDFWKLFQTGWLRSFFFTL